jgi:hypothetical protein
MIERICETCCKPVKGKLFRGKCRSCYDRSRKTTMVSIWKKSEKLFREYQGERDDTAACINELVELGLKTWKQGKRMILVPIG